jgi:GNAT superfamily N-acetyltransferase
MDGGYEVVYAEKPEWGIIGPAISDYNEQQAGDDQAQTLCYVLRAADEVVVGGVIGATYWDWLHVDLMWVKEELRGQGYGHRLLTMAEEEARRRGAKHAFLDTFTFQAPEFYKKHGYVIFGELNEFPAGHRRYFMSKQL